MAQVNDIQSKIEFFKKRLYNTQIDKKLLLGILKNDYSFNDIKKIIGGIGANPFVSKYFYGIPFPKLSELGEVFYVYTTDNLEKELLIQCLSFVKYAIELNAFIGLKNKYENFLLLGNYGAASGVLTEIEISFGYSLWLIENKFIVVEAIGGVKSNKEYLNFINQTNDNAWVTSFAHFLSIRAENVVSPFSFISKLDSFQSGLGNKLQEYLAFRLNFLLDVREVSDLCDVVTYDAVYSMVDRYLTFVKICQIVDTSINKPDWKTAVINALRFISNKIDDPILRNYLIKFQLIKEVEVSPFDAAMLDVYEDYTNGQYERAIEGSKQLLCQFPGEFSLLEIYIKSNLFLNTKPEPINGNDEALINQTIEHVHKAYYDKDEDDDTFNAILTNACLVQSMSWSLQVFNFLMHNFMNLPDRNFEVVKALNSQHLNPHLYKAFERNQQAIAYLTQLKENKALNVINLFLAINSDTPVADLDALEDTAIPKYRLKLYKAKMLKLAGDLDKASSIYEDVLSYTEIGVVLYEESFSGLLECYYLSGESNRFIKSYTEKYLERPNLLRRVDVKDIHKKIESNRFRDIDHSILLPIFYKITDRDPHMTNLSIRHFFKGYGFIRPVEITREKEHMKPEHIIYFLSQVCTSEVIKFFRYFTGTKDVLNERLEICQLLLSIDRKNQGKYDREISKIAQNLVIFEGVKQVDESKIYIDEKGIRTNELKENRIHFGRYLEISELIKTMRIVVIDISNNKKVLLRVAENRAAQEDVGKARASENIVFDFFGELFFEIRDKFLFSTKFGLDSYLSTRIRHGTLLGQIRNPIQEQQLITQRDKENEEYSENQYWNRKLGVLEDSKKEALQQCLAEFSHSVDSLANELKNDLIQIKTESKGNHGLFDYTYPPNTLLPLFGNVFFSIGHYDEFLDAVFAELWNMTHINLEVIRNYISTKYKTKFFDRLHDLETKLKALKIESKEFQELLTSIINCRINISYEMDRIAGWFQIREAVVTDFSIDKVIETCIEITNKISQGTKLQLINRDIQSAAIIKGDFFVGTFDLLKIFLENIVKYSLLDTFDLKVDIFVFEQGDWMTIIIKNNLGQEVDTEDLKRKFEQKKRDLDAPNWDSSKVNKEEGTGFYKAKKILTTDLQDERNSFTFTVSEEQEVVIKISLCLTFIRR